MILIVQYSAHINVVILVHSDCNCTMGTQKFENNKYKYVHRDKSCTVQYNVNRLINGDYKKKIF